MEQDFWHAKWQNNEIGFHEQDGNPLLRKFMDVFSRADKPRVLVPLCGKTHDIHVLLAHGYEVVGIELSEVAVTQLFDELNAVPEITDNNGIRRYTHDRLTVLAGDIFSVTQAHVGRVTAVYDRAALVALPDDMRRAYAVKICQLAPQLPQLLITFDYHQAEMAGPPFSVPQEMVEQLYGNDYRISRLYRRPIEGGLKQQVAADCLAFSLSPLPVLNETTQ
ncbi:thiopurine S-methyltransferase [Alteromonas halophila]|uniref:Thiopurine S-methyltransferase n=1 Tax=Alteromonas halophila TaxID=516698 RepID=A0A918MV43_9ALTE|nr:thiopurine S-methyltransferase [Alteromonas halophila]GGW75467.1 thiopurine S-methyltransferase [Alteromonas halophila]